MASADLFLSQGYDKTSMDAVANEASVSKQTLYSHFANKEDLFRACIKGKVEDYGLDLSWADPDAPVENTLVRFGMQLLELFNDKRVMAMYRLLMAESTHHPQLCQAFYECGPLTTKQLLAEYLQKQHDLDRIELDDAFDAAELFISVVERSFMTKLLLGVGETLPPGDTEPYVRQRVRWFLGALNCG